MKLECVIVAYLCVAAASLCPEAAGASFQKSAFELRTNVHQETLQGRRIDEPPAFMKQLYDSIESKNSSANHQVHLLANPCHSVSQIRNQTSIPFLLCDDGFTSRKQFWLVVTVDRKPAQECPQWPHAAAKEDAGQGEEAIDIVDVTSDDKTFNLTWSYDNTLVLDRYRLVNVTDIVVKVITDSIMVSTGNSSVLISFRVKNVNAECDSIAATENYSPLLVAFDDSEFRFEEVFSSAVAEPDEQRANKSQFIRDSTKIREKRETGRRCQLRNWYVDFSELGLDHLIYTPSGYHANFCDGSCHFEFLLVNLFSIEPVENNHAMLRRFYRQYVNHEEQNVVIPPHVTCAPTSLKSLTMLYRDAVHSYYVLNSVPNMIVTDCGCI